MTCLSSHKPAQLSWYRCNSTFLGTFQKSHQHLAEFLHSQDLWAQAGGSHLYLLEQGACSRPVSPKMQFVQSSHHLHGFVIFTVIQIKLLISGRKMTNPVSSYQKQLLWLLRQETESAQFPCSIFGILLVFLRFLISWHTETFIFSYSANPQVCRKVKNLSSSAACDALKCFNTAAPECLIPSAMFAQVCPLLPNSLLLLRCFLANSFVWRGLHCALEATQTSRAFEVLSEEAVTPRCSCRKKVRAKVKPVWQTEPVQHMGTQQWINTRGPGISG